MEHDATELLLLLHYTSTYYLFLISYYILLTTHYLLGGFFTWVYIYIHISILFWPALRIFVSFKIERGDFRIPAVDQIQRTSLSQKNHEGKNNAYHRVILTLSSVSQDNDQPRHNKFAILRPRSDENLIATD